MEQKVPEEHILYTCTKLLVTTVTSEESSIKEGTISLTPDFFYISTKKDEQSKKYSYKDVSAHGITKAAEGTQTFMISFVEDPSLPQRIEIVCEEKPEDMKELLAKFTECAKQCQEEPQPEYASKEEDVEVNMEETPEVAGDQEGDEDKYADAD